MSTAIEEGKRILTQEMPTAETIARAREQLDLALAEQPQSFDVIDLQRRIDMAEAVRTMYNPTPPTIAEVRAQLDAQLTRTREVSTVNQARDLAAMVRAARLLHDLEAAQ